ncbi:MAG: D-alanyl-D-alanine carboxypeptidase family protein [Gammaproteobacteria bacterium]
MTALHEALAIPPALGMRRGLPPQREAGELVDVGPDMFGRPQRLAPAAAQAWQLMQAGAGEAGIELQLVSAFRSIDYQCEVIRRKLRAGRTIEDILAANAPPGFSEHHSGLAVDVATPGSRPLEEEFESTAAFAWLNAHAASFGFRLSYPRDNRHGLMYEPWHWAYRPDAAPEPVPARNIRAV